MTGVWDPTTAEIIGAAFVDEWRLLHLGELLANWERAAARQSLRRIDPLE